MQRSIVKFVAVLALLASPAAFAAPGTGRGHDDGRPQVRIDAEIVLAQHGRWRPPVVQYRPPREFRGHQPRYRHPPPRYWRRHAAPPPRYWRRHGHPPPQYRPYRHPPRPYYRRHRRHDD